MRRESSRLTQIQDIAGCRVVVGDIESQNVMAGRLLRALPASRLIDRRQSPSFGYRAVHVVCKGSLAPIEVQIRSALQHAWAELSEKLSDQFGAEIKYGRGDEQARTLLEHLSITIAKSENAETSQLRLLEARRQLHEAMQGLSVANLSDVNAAVLALDQEMALLSSGVQERKAALLSLLNEAAESLVLTRGG